jgi:hypothetical protein
MGVAAFLCDPPPEDSMLVTNAVAAVLWIPLLTLAIVAGVIFGRLGGSRIGLNRWAKTNGYRLISAERRYLDRGLFPEHSPRGLGVFHVTVEDRAGQIRRGYVRCSIGILALLSDEAMVRWEE